LSLGFCKYSPPCPRGGFCRRCAPEPSALAPPGVPPSTFLSVDGGCSRTSSFGTSQGPVVDVFNFGGGRYRTCCQHPPGVRHRRLQLRWWPLSDLPPAPPGARRRCLQLRWWPMSDLPSALPRGPAIDVFNFGGGRYRICRQHPQVAHHRRYLALMVGAHGPLAPAPPGGSPRRFLMFMVGAPRSLAPIGPICGITASPEVGPGAFVGTLKTGYPCIQVLSQDKEQGVHPRTAT
jgi:hypothetical protein